MRKIGLLFGIILSAVALYGVVSLYRDFQRDIAEAGLRLTDGSDVIRTSIGPIEYAIAGNGEPVVVVHGAGGGYDQGLLVSEAWIGGDYRRIAVSRFGYLRSPLPDEPSHSLQADIIAELLDSLEIEEVAIMGISAGGPSTIQFALRHTQRCRAVVLVSAISHKHPPLGWFHNRALDLLFASDFLFWAMVSYLPTSFHTAFGIPPQVQATLTTAQRDSISYFLHSIIPISLRKQGTAYDRIVREVDLPLERIKVPLLVIHAEDDNIVPFANAAHVQNMIPNAQVLFFKQGGHLLIGQYHRVKKTIRDFLTRSRNDGEKP